MLEIPRGRSSAHRQVAGGAAGCWPGDPARHSGREPETALRESGPLSAGRRLGYEGRSLPASDEAVDGRAGNGFGNRDRSPVAGGDAVGPPGRKWLCGRPRKLDTVACPAWGLDCSSCRGEGARGPGAPGTAQTATEQRAAGVGPLGRMHYRSHSGLPGLHHPLADLRGPHGRRPTGLVESLPPASLQSAAAIRSYNEQQPVNPIRRCEP